MAAKPPAWASYAAGSEAEHFAQFCSTHLIQSVDDWAGKPLELEPFQRRMMGEALAFDSEGWPVWRSVVILIARKNGKTQLLAGFALYRLLTSEGAPEILLAAASDKNAGRLFDAAAAFVRKSELLRDLIRVRDHVGELAREDGGGKIIRLASDPTKLHGYNPSLVVCDELAQWTTPSLRKAYTALTSGGGARRAPQVFTISTAGEAHERADGLLGRMLDRAQDAGEAEVEPGLTVARLWDARLLVYNHEAPTEDPYDTKALKLANPASWITEEYLARQAADPELTDSEVLQLHGGVWAARSDAWLPAGTWEACRVPRPIPPKGTPVVLGFDGSDRRDSTALVGCTMDGHLFVVGVWERPTRGGEWRVPRHEVEARLHEAMGQWDVRELVCDPPGWHREIEEWGERYGETLTIMYPTNRMQLMAAACSKFFTAVVERRLTHDGDPTLARHLANAVTKDTVHGRYITKDHPASRRKIDAAVAAVVAYDIALRTVTEPVFASW